MSVVAKAVRAGRISTALSKGDALVKLLRDIGGCDLEAREIEVTLAGLRKDVKREAGDA